MHPPFGLAPPALGFPRDVFPTPTSLAADPTGFTLASHQRPTLGIDRPPINGDATHTVGVVLVSVTPTPGAEAEAAAEAPPDPTATAPAATTTPPPGDKKPQDGDKDEGGGAECRLLGPFALLVQLALGGLALLSLVYKRWRERPQRPVRIWFFDASKQVVGSVLVHIANVFMSMLTSGRLDVKVSTATVSSTAGSTVASAAGMLLRRAADEYTPNPCSFYLLNLAIDTTIGIPILIVLLRVTTVLVSYTEFGKPAESIQSGNYGSPPKTWWWFKQSLIYFIGLFGMKICVLILFLMLPWISRIGDWALGWTEGNEKLQIVFVMMLFPLIMNALQYYIIDSFIKKKEAASGDDASDAPNVAGGAYDALTATDDEESDDDDLEESRKGRQTQIHVADRDNSKDREYDPALDGDSRAASGGSSSSSAQKKKTLPKELYPHE